MSWVTVAGGAGAGALVGGPIGALIGGALAWKLGAQPPPAAQDSAPPAAAAPPVVAPATPGGTVTDSSGVQSISGGGTIDALGGAIIASGGSVSSGAPLPVSDGSQGGAGVMISDGGWRPGPGFVGPGGPGPGSGDRGGAPIPISGPIGSPFIRGGADIQPVLPHAALAGYGEAGGGAYGDLATSPGERFGTWAFLLLLGTGAYVVLRSKHERRRT